MEQPVTKETKKKRAIWISRVIIALSFIFIFFQVPSVSAAGFWGEDNTKQVQNVKDIMTGPLPIVMGTIFGSTSEGAGTFDAGYNGFYKYVTEDNDLFKG